jgi:methyl-accepting chemotaxis protein
MIDFLFFMRKTIFRKVFVITWMVALVPLFLLWLYLLKDSQGFQAASRTAVIFYALFGLATLLAIIGTYFLSKRISLPITHFTRTATEIARGNFNERVIVESQDELGGLAKI